MATCHICCAKSRYNSSARGTAAIETPGILFVIIIITPLYCHHASIILCMIFIYECFLGCARFTEIVWSARICLSLCLVDCHALTLQLPIQKLHSLVLEFQQNEHTPANKILYGHGI